MIRLCKLVLPFFMGFDTVLGKEIINFVSRDLHEACLCGKFIAGVVAQSHCFLLMLQSV